MCEKMYTHWLSVLDKIVIFISDLMARISDIKYMSCCHVVMFLNDEWSCGGTSYEIIRPDKTVEMDINSLVTTYIPPLPAPDTKDNRNAGVGCFISLLEAPVIVCLSQDRKKVLVVMM